ncbi:hypothetical protein [Treponema sp. R80B11-R83G3]
MNDIVNSINKILQDHKEIETSSFYKDYQQFSRIYDSLIQEGITHRRESQLKTIQDQNNTSAFTYNTIK